MMKNDNQIHLFDSYLKGIYKLGGNLQIQSEVSPVPNPYDEWLTIFANLKFEEGTGSFGSGLSGVFTQINFEKTDKIHKEGKITIEDLIIRYKDSITDYPFNEKLIQKILNLEYLYIGNAELGEQVRINHIEPIRYLKKIKELCICCNTVTTLKPIWDLPNLRRVWIENTLIPLEERKLFRKEHPSSELAEQIYL